MYAVDGTPTDCVNIAVTQIFKRPAGSRRLRHQQGLESRRRCDVFGDRGGRARGRAARRARRWPCRCAARRTYDFSHAAQAAAAVTPAMLAASAAGADVSQHQRADGASRRAIASPCRRSGITSRRSPSGTIRRGKPYYWIEEGQDDWEPHDRSDYQAVRDGYVSVTPLHPDLTAHQALAAVERLSFEAEAKVR